MNSSRATTSLDGLGDSAKVPEVAARIALVDRLSGELGGLY